MYAYDSIRSSTRRRQSAILFFSVWILSSTDAFQLSCVSHLRSRSPSQQVMHRVKFTEQRAEQLRETLAREWTARNSDSWDATSQCRVSRSNNSPTSPEFRSVEPAPPSSVTVSGPSTSDLAREWAARNKPAAPSVQATFAPSSSISVQTSLTDLATLWTARNRAAADNNNFPTLQENSAVDPLLKQVNTPVRSTHGDYESLQKVLEDRNTVTEGEDQYAIEDGETLGSLDSPDISQATIVAIQQLSDSDQLSDTDRAAVLEQIKRFSQPRPYPLFLAEKAAELVESSLEGMYKAIRKAPESKPFVSRNMERYTRVATHDGRKRVVVLGTGWGAAAFLKEIDTDRYNVTVISPRNHFIFTPMLAGASVGTVEYRSITQPIREINTRVQFLEATATDVDAATQVVTCQSVMCDGNSCDICEFDVSYDRLVITVGAQTNTFGIPGVRENCCFLKQVEDARRIRTAIVNCFERANLPGLTDEEREHDLTFAVIGAGPTGIEFAAELRDFVEQDGPKYYPNLVKHVRIKVIASSSTVLAPFDKSLQQEAIQQLGRAARIMDPAVRRLLPTRFKLTELLLESAVKEVADKTIVLKDGTQVPYGLAVWAAGNGPIPLTLDVIEGLGSEQEREQTTARGRIAVDPWMRAIGGEGKLLAFGDCSCICQGGQQLPATAQVASQQGEYLAGMMNRRFDLSPSSGVEGILPPPTRDPKLTESALSDRIAGIHTDNLVYAKPFQFLNLGILAYTGGGSALAQVETAPGVPPLLGSGKFGNLLWRSVYLSKQVSFRNRLLVLNDWTKKKLFGRDITRV